MFYVSHENGREFAKAAPVGETMSPRFVTDNFRAAQPFDTWGDASDVSQNFGPEWAVEEV